MFGTFVAEDPEEPCDYGLVVPMTTLNPLTILFQEYTKYVVEPHCCERRCQNDKITCGNYWHVQNSRDSPWSWCVLRSPKT